MILLVAGGYVAYVFISYSRTEDNKVLEVKGGAAETAVTGREYTAVSFNIGFGARILDKIEEMPELAVGARRHHERIDGAGYPSGLKGDEIPVEARILAVADAYDAMTSKRSYRDAMPQSKVREEIENGLGAQFDEKFGGIMLEMIDEDKDFLLRESA